jgi:hypothetical protein
MQSRRQFVQSIAAVITTPGGPPRSIFLSPEASPSEKWAAEQMSLVLEQISGARLAIITGDKPPASLPAIAVGRSVVTDRFAVEVPGRESCTLRTVGGILVIAGGRQRGTMYGVFCFLERLGCRWYTADVARIPKIRRLSVPELNEIVGPAFEYREVFFTEAQGKEWSARNRLNGNFHQLDESVGGRISFSPFAHSFYDLVPPARYFDAHPEYFALFAGQRRRENAQLCLTNPDVIRLAVERVGMWLAADPDVSIVSVSQNDGGGWCECDPCTQVVKEEGGAISGLLLRFVNQVAAAWPERMIDTLAYQATADPPRVVRPMRNVQIRLCPIEACQAHSFQTCAFNRQFEERLAGWSRIAPKLHLWLYSINFAHYLLPFPNERALISDVALYRRSGVSGIFVEGAVFEGGGGENAELRSYLAARLLWNPGIDAHSEIRGFLDAVYGPSAPLMWRYFQMRYRDAGHLWIDQEVGAEYITDRFLKDGRQLLAQALQKADAMPARRRIERHLLSFDYVEAMRGRWCRLDGGSYLPADPARARNGIQALAAKARSLGVTHLREGYPLTDQVLELEQSAESHAAITLRDSTAAATVIPDLGATVIALGPANRDVNILRVADPGEFDYPRAGGLYITLGSSYVGRRQVVEWKTRSVDTVSLALEGRSDRGLTVELEVGIEGGSLRLRTKVANPGPEAQTAVLRCRAELPLGRNAEVRFSGHRRSLGSGDRPADGSFVLAGADLPAGEWAFVSPELPLLLRNRFRTGDVKRCEVRWSLRGTPALSINVWTPEAVLLPREQLELETAYEFTASLS